MSEFAGNIFGNAENLCVTASYGRNFVPAERVFSTEKLRLLNMAIDFASVMAFVVFTVVMSI